MVDIAPILKTNYLQLLGKQFECFFMSKRLDLDTRELQKYAKIQGNWYLRDWNQLLCYFIINIGLRPDGPLAPIIGLINYVDSQSKFNDLVANKAFIHNEWVRGISNNAGNLYFKEVKIKLLIYLFLDFASHSLSMHAQNDFFPALYGHCQTVVCGALD